MSKLSIYLFIVLFQLTSLCASAETNKGLERIKAEIVFKQENKVAVIVGVDAYDRNSGLRPLKYAVADAKLLKATLQKQGYKVRLLTNHKANKTYILNAIKQAGATLNKNQGTLIFAYSGHGFASGNRNYLASYGTVANNLASSGLSLNKIKQAIRKTGAKRVMLFIDACRDNPTIKGSKSVRNASFVRDNSEGLKVLYSTKFHEVSWESSQLRHGVFSYYLNKALTGAAADNKGIISFTSVKNYVQQEVSGWTFENNMPSTQKPFSSGDSFGVFVLGRIVPTNYQQQKPVVRKVVKGVNHFHGIKRHQHPLPNTGIAHRHGQGVLGSNSKQRQQAIINNPILPIRVRQIYEPKMVKIRGGTFTMGSPANEKVRLSDEKPHRVTIKDFWIGKTEVTFAQWDACVAGGGCKSNKHPNDEGWGRGNHPVINVSWHDANEYTRWLSQKTGKDYRLPTEAEWEYAARGGTKTAFSFGNRITTNQANYNGNYTYNGSRKGKYLKRTAKVSSYPANRYALYDMHGNVWEWTCSAYDENYGGSERQCTNRNDNRSRVLRGGSWYYFPRDLRSAGRSNLTATNRSFGVGFRISRTF